MLKEEYGFDYEIIRGKDKDTYSYWSRYKFAHDFVKVLILPPYAEFSEEAISSFKPIKIFYT